MYTKHINNIKFKKKDTAYNYGILSNIIDNFNFFNKKNNDNTYIINNTTIKKIIVIGDIHGDYECLLKTLKLGNIIDKNIKYTDHIKDVNWIDNKNCVVIQIGDLIDMKCRYNTHKSVEKGDNLRIFKLLYKLQIQAKEHKSIFICLLGNHEIDNVMGNFKYTSENEFLEFYNEYSNKYKDGYIARKILFSRGNLIAKHLSYNFMAIVVVNNWLFVHAGINIDIIQKYTIAEMNTIFKNWLKTTTENTEYDNDITILYKSKNSLLKNRYLAYLKDNTKNLNYFTLLLDEINKKNNIKLNGIIIGHTPQEKGITNCFKNKLWKIDIGMSQAFTDSNNNIHVLQINKDNTFTIL